MTFQKKEKILKNSYSVKIAKVSCSQVTPRGARWYKLCNLARRPFHLQKWLGM